MINGFICPAPSFANNAGLDFWALVMNANQKPLALITCPRLFNANDTHKKPLALITFPQPTAMVERDTEMRLRNLEIEIKEMRKDIDALKASVKALCVLNRPRMMEIAAHFVRKLLDNGTTSKKVRRRIEGTSDESRDSIGQLVRRDWAADPFALRREDVEAVLTLGEGLIHPLLLELMRAHIDDVEY